MRSGDLPKSHLGVVGFVVLGLGLPPMSAAADHVTADEVRAAVATAPATSVDLSGKDMSGDDLTGLDLGTPPWPGRRSGRLPIR
jgi:hypothetical protein